MNIHHHGHIPALIYSILIFYTKFHILSTQSKYIDSLRIMFSEHFNKVPVYCFQVSAKIIFQLIKFCEIIMIFIYSIFHEINFLWLYSSLREKKGTFLSRSLRKMRSPSHIGSSFFTFSFSTHKSSPSSHSESSPSKS